MWLIRDYLQVNSPYKGLLLFHGLGVGKTCAAIGIAENFRDFIILNGKKILIIGLETLKNNWKNEIFNIDKVDYNSSAINEALNRGDIIVAIEGYKIESLEEIKAVLVKLDFRAGDEIILTVLREDNFKDIKLTLGEVWKEEAWNL